MSYEKQTWVNGEVITANKLNHMEDGIERASEIGLEFVEIPCTRDSNGRLTLGKTWQELYDMMQSNKVLYFRFQEEYTSPVIQRTKWLKFINEVTYTNATSQEGSISYSVMVSGKSYFFAQNANSYPTA